MIASVPIDATAIMYSTPMLRSAPMLSGVIGMTAQIRITDTTEISGPG